MSAALLVASSMTDVAVKLDTVCLHRPGFTLGPVSLTLDVGLTVIVGASGSGKTTLLTLAAGLFPASSGMVLHNGLDLTTLSDGERARVRCRTAAYVAQQPLFLSELTVAGNLAFAARLYKVASGVARGATTGCSNVISALNAVDMADSQQRIPASLSGGEQARVHLARALLSPAATLMIDEPTASLDDKTAGVIRAVIQSELRARPLLIATHDAALIAIANSIVRLEQGQVSTS